MLKRTVVSRSIAMAFGLMALGTGIAPTAYAQSTVVGSVYGEVSPGAGSQVQIDNVDTGARRTVTIGTNGRFNVGALPPGRYRASLLKDGKSVNTVELSVLGGQGAEAVFAGSGVTRIEVTGRTSRIDKSSTVSASIFTAKQLDQIPLVTKDVNGIVNLAANTTKADSRYAGGISIGGGGPSENSYYINGFPVTNALTQLGSIELPTGAIQQAQVQTGGFGAEFGRSVGGVVNIITKSGTNEFHGGVGASVEPNSLRSKPRNSYYATTGAAGNTDNTIYFDRSHNTRQETNGSLYIGGPIIQDKLFFFVAADQTKRDTASINATPQSSGVGQTGWDVSSSKNTRYLAKIDWNISDNHRLEGTVLGDNYKTTDDFYGYSYATGRPTTYSYSQYSKNLANVTPGVGGEAQILRYTGNITQDLQISALIGRSTSRHEEKFNFLPTAPTILYTDVTKNPTLSYPTPANPLPAASTGIPDGAHEETKSFRLDVEYQLGTHLLRAGLDENRLKSLSAGEAYLGGAYYRYFNTTNGAYSGPGGSTNRHSLISLGAVPVNGTYYYVRKRLFTDVTDAQSNQSAQYLEDRWQATKDLNLTLGLRNEQFNNKNGDGETFLKMTNFISPRAAAAWDVFGDTSMKVFGTLGRYSLQIPTHIAVRGASRSTLTDQFYVYTGVDPATGAPTGLKSINDPFSGNNEYGQPKDAKTVAAQNMKPTYQDEITLGIEKALTPKLTGGVKVTYRRLGDTIDDFCDQRPIDNYATANKIDESNYGGFGCATINPGKSNTLLVDYAGNGTYTTVPLSAADIGLPKAKRTYFALDFFLEHPLSDGWYGKVTYTYSKSRGNTEGQTKSDNAQTDVAATSTWDFPELMEGSNGYLPNDRTHQIKAYGYVQATPEFGFGASARAESGRPKNCFGDYAGSGTDVGGGAYGAVFFYCGGVFAPRGSQGRLPWSTSLDVNTVYKPAGLKGVAVRVDVFNLLNRQAAEVIEEAHDSVNNYGGVNPAYGHVISYSAPRKVRLSVNYDF